MEATEQQLRERIKHLEYHLTMITHTDPTSPQSMIIKKYAEALWKNRLKEPRK
ncbi:MAG TPA: hypothetical protein VK085_11485 [Pseudogracilibacillus sp.]|nr:hypothetical protein [Pseudogracilibacillus sp.]